MKIDICLPSRSRPHRVETFLNSMGETANYKNIHVYLCIEPNELELYSTYFEEFAPFNVTILKAGRRILSKLWNQCYRAGSGEIVMLAGDDLVFETDSWDLAVKDYFYSLPDKIGLFYGQDGHNVKNATHPFVSRKSCEILGYFTPPYFEADFNDLWLHQVYEKIGRLHYDPSVMIRHLHKNVDSKYDDQTYKISDERRVRAAKVWEEKKYEISTWSSRLAANMTQKAIG